MINQTAYVAPLCSKRIIVALATALNSMYLLGAAIAQGWQSQLSALLLALHLLYAPYHASAIKAA
jgi:hypothetical protein